MFEFKIQIHIYNTNTDLNVKTKLLVQISKFTFEKSRSDFI